MSTTTAHHKAEKDESPKDKSTDRFSSDLEELKTSFGQLREDVTTLLKNASGTARSGAGMLKDRAASAALDLRHRGVESVERVEHKIGQKPLLSVALALGIGFIFAKLFMRRR
jgi:ElaB/YqjD/DUF883 family membrane-anchored ribosome-binding protein